MHSHFGFSFFVIPKLIAISALRLAPSACEDSPNAEKEPLPLRFYQSYINSSSVKTALIVAETYGFVQESDPDRKAFYQNETAGATIQVLNENAIFLSNPQTSIDASCEIMETIAGFSPLKLEQRPHPPYFGMEFEGYDWESGSYGSNAPRIELNCYPISDDGYSAGEVRLQFE